MRCAKCGKKITKTMIKKQQVIKLEVGHSLEGMWDDKIGRASCRERV